VVQYLGLDWAYRRAAWCAVGEGGAIVGEGVVPADDDGLARLVLAVGSEVRACVEMMSGAVWVRDRLAAAGWEVQVAHPRKVRDVAPLACKTDRVDARVLAELCRRDLVPALWIPSIDNRALRERLRRRMHLVRMRASAQNRIFGLLTQWGLRVSLKRLREPDAMAMLEARGVPEPWRASITEALAVIDLLDARTAPFERELRALAAADRRVMLLRTIPGVGDLLGLTIASERSATSRASPRRASSSATPDWLPGSVSPVIASGPARCPRPARGRCAGPPSRQRTSPGGRPTPGTGSTPTSPNARARTRPSRPSRARS
jgi:transposase